MDEDAHWLTTTEVAARLGIHVSRVRRLADRYAIGSKLANRAWLFSEDDYRELERRSTGKAGRPRREANPGETEKGERH